MDIKDVKKNLDKMVVYNGKPDIYRFTACTIRRFGNNIGYQAEIQDTKNGKSVLICRLEDIEVME